VICRVCGVRFAASRCHAVTCTPTCRKRLQRGQAFAYFAELSDDERRTERAYHAARDHWIEASVANRGQVELPRSSIEIGSSRIFQGHGRPR
jgi:hypothetical protein